ncbi:hypothetical protein FOXYSP1_18351 [Fusarium oxysporum f. sp. phaseoli]
MTEQAAHIAILVSQTQVGWVCLDQKGEYSIAIIWFDRIGKPQMKIISPKRTLAEPIAEQTPLQA